MNLRKLLGWLLLAVGLGMVLYAVLTHQRMGVPAILVTVTVLVAGAVLARRSRAGKTTGGH